MNLFYDLIRMAPVCFLSLSARLRPCLYFVRTARSGRRAQSDQGRGGGTERKIATCAAAY